MGKRMLRGGIKAMINNEKIAMTWTKMIDSILPNLLTYLVTTIAIKPVHRATKK